MHGRADIGGDAGLIADRTQDAGGLPDLAIVADGVLQQTEIAAEDSHGGHGRPAADK